MHKLKFVLTPILFFAAAGALSAQTVTPNPTSLTFSALVGVSVQSAPLAITTSTGVQALATSNSSWLKIDGSASIVISPGTLTITADPTGLTANTYTATISLNAIGTNGFGPTVNVPVTFAVGTIGVNQTSFSFSYQSEGTVPAAQSVTLTAAQSTPYTVTLTPSGSNGCSWLTVPTSGTAPGTLALTPDASALPSPGTYACTITITPSNAPGVPITATLTVTAAPTVTANPTTVNLTYQLNGATGSTNSGSQPLTLANPGSQPLTYYVSPFTSTTPSWLSVNPNQGTIPANGSVQVTVSYVTSAGLAAGTYQGTLAVIVPNAANSPINVPVNLLVSSQPLLTVPTATVPFTYQVGASTPAAQNVLATTTEVAANSPSGQMPLQLSATTASGGAWLEVPQTAETGTAFSISLNAQVLAALQPGNYTGTVSVIGIGSANATASSPITIPVTLKVTNDPLVAATFGGCTQGLVSGLTCPMNFAYETGQSNPTTQTVTVTSSNSAALTITPTVTMSSQTACGTSWLAVSQVITGSPSSPAFGVSVSPTGVANGTTCNGTLSLAAVNPADGNASPNSPLTIPVALYVNNTGMLVASPIALNFNVGLNAAPSYQTLNITSTGASTSDQLSFTAATPVNVAWLQVFPSSGNTASGSNTVTVLAAPSSMAPGTYVSQITITATASGVLDSPLTVPVTMTVAGPTMTVTPTGTLSFAQILGTAAPQPKQLTVATSGSSIAFTTSVVMQQQSSVGWLTATPSSATATSANSAAVEVAVNGSNLPAGTYNGSVVITATTAGVQGSPATVPVTFVVSPGTLSVTKTSLAFNAAQGSAAQSLPVTVNGTPSPLTFSVTTSSTAPWLSVSATSGTTPATLQVTANPAGLQPAQYTGTVTITANGATGSPQTINVTLNVGAAQTFNVSTSTLNFSYVIGGTTTVQPQSVQLTASGGSAAFTAAASSGASWLQVSPSSGSTPATLAISVTPSGLAAGNYTGAINITSSASASNPAASIAVSLTVTAVPAPVISAVQNAASAIVGAGVAPGENIVIYGTGVGPATLAFGAIANGALATSAGGVQVLFDGRAAPVYYASATQTSVFVPYGVANQANTKMQVVYQGVPSQTITYNVVATAPGVYTSNASGSGPAVAWNYDAKGNYTGINTSSNPVVKGGVVALYETGEGATTGPVGIDGMVVTNLYKPLATVTATVGGVPATVQYAGSAPGSFYGVMQVNLLVPAGAQSGQANAVVIDVGGNNSQSNVTLYVQ